MKSSNLKRLCYVVLAFILAFSMSSCKREDIVSDTVVDSTESTSLCETESATENVDESFSADSKPVSELRSIEKNSAKQKHIKNDNGTVKETITITSATIRNKLKTIQLTLIHYQ